jgi:hypothetical protein
LTIEIVFRRAKAGYRMKADDDEEDVKDLRITDVISAPNITIHY